MTKITLTSLANLQNETTAVNAINANSATIVAAIDNTLSRDGTSPNTMNASLDMNSNRVLNLPQPLSSGEPARLQDITNFQGSVIPTSVIPATPADMFLTSNGTTYVPRNIVGSDLPNPTTTSLGGTFAKPQVAGQVIGGVDTAGNPQLATSGTFTSASTTALAVGRLGAVTPAFQVDSSQASSITGIRVSSQSTGNGVNLNSVGETNVPLIINAAGAGTVNFNTTGTGVVSSFRNFNVNHDTSPTITIGSAGGTVGVIATPGTSGLAFNSNGATQVQINNTTSATRALTLTGSNGGNPTIGTTAGSVAFSAPIDGATLATRLVKGVFVLGASAVAVPLTGSTAETTLATVSIPANSMGTNGIVRVTAQYSYTNVAAGNWTPRIKFNGTAYYDNVNTSAGLSGRFQAQFANRNATNSQVGNAIGQVNWSSSTTNIVTSAHDTTTSLNLIFTGQLASASDTMKLESYLVELIVP